MFLLLRHKNIFHRNLFLLFLPFLPLPYRIRLFANLVQTPIRFQISLHHIRYRNLQKLILIYHLPQLLKLFLFRLESRNHVYMFLCFVYRIHLPDYQDLLSVLLLFVHQSLFYLYNFRL